MHEYHMVPKRKLVKKYKSKQTGKKSIWQMHL